MSSFSIPKPPYFNFQEICWFLDRGYDDCLHQVSDTSIRKLLRIENELVLIQISETTADLRIEVLNCQKNVKAQVTAFVRDWFDLDRDLDAFYEHLRSFPPLEQRIGQFKGLRLLSISDLFEALAWAIIGQQINLTFAYRLKRRLVEKYGEQLLFEGELYYHFPHFSQLISVEVAELKEMQFSTRKAEYLIGIAQSLQKASISKTSLLALSNTDAMIVELCKLRGIGEWTANYALMKSLKRMDSIPYGDAGLLKAIQLTNQTEHRPSKEEVTLFFEPHQGWEAYITFYLWQSLSTKKPLSNP